MARLVESSGDIPILDILDSKKRIFPDLIQPARGAQVPFTSAREDPPPTITPDASRMPQGGQIPFSVSPGTTPSQEPYKYGSLPILDLLNARPKSKEDILSLLMEASGMGAISGVQSATNAALVGKDPILAMHQERVPGSEVAAKMGLPVSDRPTTGNYEETLAWQGGRRPSGDVAGDVIDLAHPANLLPLPVIEKVMGLLGMGAKKMAGMGGELAERAGPMIERGKAKLPAAKKFLSGEAGRIGSAGGDPFYNRLEERLGEDWADSAHSTSPSVQRSIRQGMLETIQSMENESIPIPSPVLAARQAVELELRTIFGRNWREVYADALDPYDRETRHRVLGTVYDVLGNQYGPANREGREALATLESIYDQELYNLRVDVQPPPRNPLLEALQSESSPERTSTEIPEDAWQSPEDPSKYGRQEQVYKEMPQKAGKPVTAAPLHLELSPEEQKELSKFLSTIDYPGKPEDVAFQLNNFLSEMSASGEPRAEDMIKQLRNLPDAPSIFKEVLSPGVHVVPPMITRFSGFTEFKTQIVMDGIPKFRVVLTLSQDKKDLYVNSLFGTGGTDKPLLGTESIGFQKLGAATIKELARRFKATYPEVETLSMTRIGGKAIKTGGDRHVSLPINRLLAGVPLAQLLAEDDAAEEDTPDIPDRMGTQSLPEEVLKALRR